MLQQPNAKSLPKWAMILACQSINAYTMMYISIPTRKEKEIYKKIFLMVVYSKNIYVYDCTYLRQDCRISTKLTLISGSTVIQSHVVNFYVSMLLKSKIE